MAVILECIILKNNDFKFDEFRLTKILSHILIITVQKFWYIEIWL